MATIKQIENIDGRCNCLALRKASRYLTAVYDRALAGVGLRATQFSMLYKLASQGPTSIGELAAVMAMDRTTLSANLKPMERDGLVEIVPSEVDRRAKAVKLTRQGRAAYLQAFPLWEAVQEEFESSYGAKEAKSLRESARSVLDSGFEPWAEKV
jgi:DNA-binding MarR family transcriptional regulator